MTTTEILQASASELKQLIIDQIRTLQVTQYGAVNATGKLANSVEVEFTTNGYRILLYEYAYYLVYGRKPGNPPPVSALEEWAKAKGIQLGALYGIAKKIGEKGTTIYQQNQGKESGLFRDVIEKAVTELAKAIFDFQSEEITSNILKGFQDAFNPLQ